MQSLGIVDRHAGKAIHKVLGTLEKNGKTQTITCYAVKDEATGEPVDLFQDGDRKICMTPFLSEARKAIGKVINHPEKITKPKSAYAKDAKGGPQKKGK